MKYICDELIKHISHINLIMSLNFPLKLFEKCFLFLASRNNNVVSTAFKAINECFNEKQKSISLRSFKKSLQ